MMIGKRESPHFHLIPELMGMAMSNGHVKETKVLNPWKICKAIVSQFPRNRLESRGVEKLSGVEGLGVSVYECFVSVCKV